MTLRYRLACAFLVLSGTIAAPSFGQSTPKDNPLASQIQGVRDAETAVKKAQADVTRARDKVKVELRKKPEWASLQTDLTKAENDLKTSQRNAMNAVHAKPEYLELVKQRDEAQKVVAAAQATSTPGSSDDKVSDSDYAKANNDYAKAVTQMKAMERQAIADDPSYTDAKARIDASNAKLAQMDAEVDDTLKTDTDYQQLAQALTQAQEQLAAAKQALVTQRQQIAQQRASEAQNRSSRSK